MLSETPPAISRVSVRPGPAPAADTAVPESAEVPFTPPTSPDEYDGSSPFPEVGAPPRPRADRVLQLVVTWALVAMPVAGLAAAVILFWGHGVDLTDVLLGLAFYVLTGLGVTVGFHRCFTHRAFRARPALRTALAVVGSMSFEGDVISWVATHAVITLSATGPAIPTRPTATAPGRQPSCAAWCSPISAGSSATIPRRGSTTLPTCWPNGR